MIFLTKLLTLSSIPVRLGNVDYSDDSNEDESSSGEDVSSEGSSDDGDESIEDSDGEVVDDGESLLGDETEEDEVEEEVEGEEESHEDFLFDADADDEAQSGLDQEAEAGNEIIDDGLIGRGWTRIDNNDRTALGSMLMEMVQPHNLGRHQHLANGGFLVNAAETMRNILRGDLGIDGLSEFEDSLGMRLLRADRGDGRISSVGLSAGLANRAITNGLAGSGRPTVQIINSGVIASSNRHLSEMR